jgi:hypothetical protein
MVGSNYKSIVGGPPSSFMKGGGRMTTYEALSIVGQFSLNIVAILTLIVAMVVLLINKKK